MELTQTPLKDCFLIKNNLYADSRGFFLESFHKEKFLELTGISMEIKQINFAKSVKNVLRGLHYQLQPYAQSKLVGVMSGAVLDVVVDVREDSPTYGRKFETLLDDPSVCLYVPRGFAHGYEVLEDDTLFYYGVDNFYSPENERGIKYDDPYLGINWKNDNNEISDKDRKHPYLEKAELNF